MINKITKDFKKAFGYEPDKVYEAPARVNLIGEHIDYNGGMVLPCAISLYTVCAVKKRNDNEIHLYSSLFKEEERNHIRSLNDLTFRKEEDWANYPLGVFKVLQDDGVSFPYGLDLCFDSNIPLGSGLSSSASLLDLTMFILNDYYHLNKSLKEQSLIARSSEVSYNGLNCGIMDEAIISLAKDNTCLYLDCAKYEYEYIPLDLKDYYLVVLKTNKPRKLTESKYNERVAECNKALDILKKYYNISNLCMLKSTDLPNIETYLNNDILYKRVKHCVLENERVKEFTKALALNDYVKLGILLNESHESLKSLYEVTGLHLDTITSLSRKQEGCLGSRMTGAGFGGCAIAIVESDKFENFKEKVASSYEQITGIKPEIIPTTIVGGPRRVK